MSSTGIKEDYFDYALFYNDISCLSDINCSGLSVYNSLVNSSLSSTTLFNNLNTLSSYSYLNISSTNNNLNNLSSYSYLNISSTNNNLNNLSSQSYFLTNYTNLNSLNVSGTTKLNGATSCISSLNVSGVTIINNNLGVLTSTINSNYNLQVNGICSFGAGSQYVSPFYTGSSMTLWGNGNTGGVPEQLIIADSGTTASANMALLIGTYYNSNTNPYSSFQSVLAGVGYKSLLFNPIGGSVGIGTGRITTMSALLEIGGTTIINGATSINNTLTISGNTILNNFTTINSPLYINTSQSTTISALNINCTSVGVLVNIVQNLGWNDGVNYALNVSGYSMFGGVQINGQDSNNIYKRVGDLTIASPSINSIILKTNYGNWEAMRLNTSGISINTSLYISGVTTLNNATTCTSSLNVSGVSNLGPLYINNGVGTQNTFFQIGTTGNILTVRGSGYTKLGCSENSDDAHITLIRGSGAYYRVNYGTPESHLFGDTTGNNFLALLPTYNYSRNPFIIEGNSTMLSNLNIIGNIKASNIATQSPFYITVTSPSYLNILISSYYKYDIDLRLYTTVSNPSIYCQTRKFKFMASLASGAHNAGNYTLNYDIDYSSINYSSGPFTAYNGLNVAAVGTPTNYNLNLYITTNPIFLLQNTFNYITVICKTQLTLQCIIVDYLK